MKKCLECSAEFNARAHNQKYCNPACCRKATNRKIMENYYKNKKRLSGEQRLCIECAAPLSRYNDDVICEACSNIKINEDYLNVLDGIRINASTGSKKKKSK